MTQNEKDILLKDLCARLSCGVKVAFLNEDLTHHSEPKTLIGIECINNLNYSRLEDEDGNTTIVEFVKPYLFPISSMTEEQYYELQNCSSDDCLEHMEVVKTLRDCTNFTHWPLYEYRVIDWFHKNHFDYRGLIEKGLAIDATELNIY